MIRVVAVATIRSVVEVPTAVVILIVDSVGSGVVAIVVVFVGNVIRSAQNLNRQTDQKRMGKTHPWLDSGERLTR